MGDFTSILDYFMIACGAYILYAAVKMRKTGEIADSILMSKNLDVKKCTDREGFIRAIVPKTMILAGATMLFGAAGIVNSKVDTFGIVYGICLAVLAVLLVWYFISYRRIMQQFFPGAQ